MRLGLQEADSTLEIPQEVCSNCYNELTQLVSHGAKLRAERQAKEHNKKMMWQSRVELVKHARRCLGQKSYSDAAMAYEKYLRVLEVVLELKEGLNPDVFRDKAHQKELTIITSVLWDLVCIYDTSTRYQTRQNKAMDLLIRFAPLTPVYPDIVKKAHHFMKIGKNKAQFKRFLKKAGVKSSRCFIATVAFKSPQAKEVVILTAFRETVMKKKSGGRALIRYYYALSPKIATFIENKPKLIWVVRIALGMISAVIEKFFLQSKVRSRRVDL